MKEINQPPNLYAICVLGLPRLHKKNLGSGDPPPIWGLGPPIKLFWGLGGSWASQGMGLYMPPAPAMPAAKLFKGFADCRRQCQTGKNGKSKRRNLLFISPKMTIFTTFFHQIWLKLGFPRKIYVCSILRKNCWDLI